MTKNTSKEIDFIKSKIRIVPDFPTKGVSFKDITPLFQDVKAFRLAIKYLIGPYLKKKIDVVVGIDARGFILAAVMAYKLGVGLAIVRKKGKLPYKTIQKKYRLEYATNVMEMHQDAVVPGQRVLLVDDVLATGGTMKATADMVEILKGKIIGICFLAELGNLGGGKKLKKYPIYSLIRYNE